jgi:Sodium/hydrogen exchanger family
MFESARGRAAALVPLLVTALWPMCPALAGEQPATEPSEAIFIAQIVLLLLVARLLGEIMQRIGQPAIMGQLIAGIVLGPSVFGALWPGATRDLCHRA